MPATCQNEDLPSALMAKLSIQKRDEIIFIVFELNLFLEPVRYENRRKIGKMNNHTT
jgi:hypothetical protein